MFFIKLIREETKVLVCPGRKERYLNVRDQITCNKLWEIAIHSASRYLNINIVLIDIFVGPINE